MGKTKDDDFIIDARKHKVEVTDNEEFVIKLFRYIIKYRYYLTCFFIGLLLGIILE